MSGYRWEAQIPTGFATGSPTVQQEKVQETRRIHDELVAQRVHELLATRSVSNATTVLQPERQQESQRQDAPGPKSLPPMPMGVPTGPGDPWLSAGLGSAPLNGSPSDSLGLWHESGGGMRPS